MGAWGGEIAPAAHYAAVTPSDTIGFAECEALYIGVAGNVVAEDILRLREHLPEERFE